MRGVVDVVEAGDDEATLAARAAGMLTSLDEGVGALVQARRAEGAALQTVLTARLDDDRAR